MREIKIIMQQATRFMKPLNPRKPVMPIRFMSLIGFMVLLLSSCIREPKLHLYDSADIYFDIPMVDINFEVYWDYEVGYNAHYDWKSEWFYGWDEQDKEIFGEIGYTAPTVFYMRRYYTKDEPKAPHTQVEKYTLYEPHFHGKFDWGYWDILVWNEVHTLDGVQSLHFDETTTLDSVTAYTNPSMYASRYQAPRFTNSFYAPEALFAAYEQAIDVNQNLEGFVYDKEREIYVKTVNIVLQPITYIYLTQVILHNNKGRVASVDGNANLSGMARSTTINTGIAGEDAITIYYNSRMKKNMPLIPYDPKTAADPGASADPSVERVDIVGGRLISFGLCKQAGNRVARTEDLTDRYNHYMDVTMQFNNGLDSTFVFNVTDQVRKRFKGGVITVELDMDTVPIPKRPGGSGFDAVVKEMEDGGTHEFEMK